MTVQVRWTAMDALFSARPITIECQTAAQPEWRPLTEEPLTNTGQFDWVVPPTLSGAVSLRIVAQDLGGHRTFSDPQTITIASTESPLSKPVAMPLVRASESTLASPSSASLPIPQTEPALTGSARAKERAGRLYEEGIKDRDQGRYREGIARLREAVQLDPERTDAIMAMGELFSLLGDQEQALRAYDLVLTRQPNMRAALVGSARALTQKKDFVGASERLRTVLRYHPADAEVWMNLGDVAIYRGDETLARDCYLRASRIDPQATEVIENARKRLALMEETVPKATTRR